MNNKGKQQVKKDVKKENKKDVKKDIKEDFQVKAYLLLYRAMKKLHTFKIQKVVRNLKKDNKKKEELVKEGAKPEALEKVTKEVEKLIKQKTKFDLVLKEHLKMLTLHILHDEYSVSFEKHTEFFEKELPGFMGKIELFNQEDNSDIQLIKWFEESIKGHKVFVEASQNLEAYISKMQEVIDKNRAKKKNRKANKKQREKEAKKEGAGEGDAMETEDAEGDEEADGEEGEGQDIVIDFSDDEEEQVKKPQRSQTPKKENKQNERKQKHQEKRNQKKERDQRDKGFKNQKRAEIEEATGEQAGEEENEGPKKPIRDMSKKDRIQHYKNLRKEYGESHLKPKVEAPKSNKRPGHEGGFKEEKIEKKFMRQDRGQAQAPGGADRGRSFQAKPQEEAVRPFDQLHPSWRANIEQKQKASIATFQGTKEKLC